MTNSKEFLRHKVILTWYNKSSNKLDSHILTNLKMNYPSNCLCWTKDSLYYGDKTNACSFMQIKQCFNLSGRFKQEEAKIQIAALNSDGYKHWHVLICQIDFCADICTKNHCSTYGNFITRSTGVLQKLLNSLPKVSWNGTNKTLDKELYFLRIIQEQWGVML